MAGSHSEVSGSEDDQQSLMLTTTTTTTAVIGFHWEVQYSRFFNSPSPSAAGHHPSLVPPTQRKSKGSWISSFRALAQLKLQTTEIDNSRSTILTVTLANNLVEEHYISKLHFTWPQVSCFSGYPPRGSRIVFLSYKDHAGQIQKFAVRFLTVHETQRFINSLKEIFGDEKLCGSGSGISNSRPSSQSEIFPSPQPVNRATKDWSPTISSADDSQLMYRPLQDWSPRTSAENFAQQTPPSGNHGPNQNSNSLEISLTQDVQDKLSAFPPSFTSLLMNCCPVTKKSQPTVTEEDNIKKEIAKCLEDSSFQDMLSKVQKVISEFGDDLLL